MQMAPLLQVEQLSVSFSRYTKGWNQVDVQVVDRLALVVEAGEVVAVIGSSGSGKSLLAHAILGILPEHARMSGTVRYKGDVLDERRLRELRGREIALVPQSVTALNPLLRVGRQLQGDNDERARRGWFERLGLADHVSRLYPHQLSGGMARRVLVATAAASTKRPQLIVTDEPTPGMAPADVREALKCFKELALEGSGVILITHDLEAAVEIADKVAVLYAGRIVEVAPVIDFSGTGEALRHPYTRALWQALPGRGFVPLAGMQPAAGGEGLGCRFAPRCGWATSDCTDAEPSLRWLREGQVSCCHAT